MAIPRYWLFVAAHGFVITGYALTVAQDIYLRRKFSTMRLVLAGFYEFFLRVLCPLAMAAAAAVSIQNGSD